MDETQLEQRRVEVKHLAFADAHEARRHDLRERVAYYAPGCDPLAVVPDRHGGGVTLETSVLEALLDLLDHHGDGRCEPLQTSSAQRDRELLEALSWSVPGRRALEAAEAELYESGTWTHPYDEDEEEEG